jgi:hypothetical protein
MREDDDMTRTGRGAPRAALAVLAFLALAGCQAGSSGGGFRESLGLSAPPPDPFLTVARRPLEMPGDATALPQPRPGAPSRVEPDATAMAQAALTGRATAAARGAAPTAGESALLSAAGADQADPAVRQQIAAEAPTTRRRFGLDSFLGRPIVQDPAAERERLQAEEEAERLRRQGLSAPVAPEPAAPRP